jgi:hypothetical protein
MRPERAEAPTLYTVLGDPAPASEIRGETKRSANKETIDNDVEMLVLEELMESA